MHAGVIAVAIEFVATQLLYIKSCTSTAFIWYAAIPLFILVYLLRTVTPLSLNISAILLQELRTLLNTLLLYYIYIYLAILLYLHLLFSRSRFTYLLDTMEEMNV